MDLERIKQNFRIRSGRARKPKKHHKPNGAPLPPNDSNQTSAPPPSHSEPQTPKKEPERGPAKISPSTAETSQGESRAEADPASKADSLPEKEPLNATPHNNKEQLAENIDGASETATLSPRPAPSDSSLQRSRSASLASEASSLDLQPPDSSGNMADNHATSSDADDFDLPPPKRRNKPPSTETLSELLFSPGHLDALLQHTPQLTRFSAFLQRYSPEHYPLLAQYLETRKAVKAVEYANAVADGLKPKETGGDHSTDTRSLAAKLDPEFEAICNASFQALMDDALPNYISYSLVKVASEIMTNEITGRSTPIMRDLVDGLSEVFCLTDPNQEDNPIIYASEEFYRFTRYGPNDVLNNNCRFLQGRKTNPNSPKRLKHAITTGAEISETLLNYKRDGRPFINLLMIAPLHDRNGKLKYHIGAQIDVSGLVEGGRALDGFQRYLARRGDEKRREEADKAAANLDDDQKRKRKALARLRDLSETFDLEEAAVVQAMSRSSSLTRDDDDAGSLASLERQKGQRRVYMDSDSSEDGEVEGEDGKRDNADWKLGDAGDGKLSGKLPGVYDSFILFRPAPSFRIVFMSPKLRKLGNVVQSPFLSHIAAPSGTLSGLGESLRSGVPVSAKVHFAPERGERREGTRLKSGSKHEDGKYGRAIWVSCTPLLGDDEAIGVWMCVVVEKSKVGSIRKRRDLQPDGTTEENYTKDSAYSPKSEKTGNPTSSRDKKSTIGSEESSLRRTDIPIKPVRIDSQTVIRSQVEKIPESAEAGQDQTSKNVRPQQSIYFDAEQGNNIDTEEPFDSRKSGQPTLGEDNPANGNQSPKLSTPQERDPRAVVTPVPEYIDEETKSASYEFGTKGSSPSSVYRDELNDEYVATHSPVTPSRQSNHRVLIEEDSDVLQDSDLDHQRDNMRVGRSRRRSSSPRSLNSPASDIPPSIPSSAMIADEGEDEHEHDDDNENEIGQAENTNVQPTNENEHREKQEQEHEHENEREHEKAHVYNDEDDQQHEAKEEEGNEKAKKANEEATDEDFITPTATRHDRSPTPPDTNDTEENNDNLEESQATIKPTSDHSPSRDSNHDSAISLDSPAHLKPEPSSKSRSRSSRPATSSQKADDIDEDQDSRTPKNLEPQKEDEISSRERDIETWVTEGRPTTSRGNSDDKTAIQDQGPGHTHTHSSTTARAVPGMRLDFLGTGENLRWAARQPRRRLDGDPGEYGDDDGIDYEDDDDVWTKSDHCATSPYSVD